MTINPEKHHCQPAQLNCPCGTETHHRQRQSRDYKLVSFASLLAISGTFNSLSKVLFIFPSRYLFAIGLESIFSFRRSIPPILRSTSKERDSQKPYRMHERLHVDGVLTLSDVFFQKNLRGSSYWQQLSRLQLQSKLWIYRVSSSRFSRPY